jgi:stearoyl-CoA desaturase (delta-9 desaturase)
VSRNHRLFLLGSTIVPPVGLLVAIVLLWNNLVGWSDIAVLVIFYFLTGFGITVGYHRLLTHRAFETKQPIKLALTTLGMMAAHGPPIAWVAHHRQHHTFADEEGDPHSPHLYEGVGMFKTLKALWFAHAGWRFGDESKADTLRYARDLLRDRQLGRLSRHFIAVTVLGVVLAGLLGFALSGRVEGFFTGMLWGGLVRLFLVHHVGFSVNSIAHFYGSRRFPTEDESRNVALLALPSLGETWHNNHHAFPTSARHGLRWWEVDLSAGVIALLERLGLAWNVVRVPPERQALKAAALNDAPVRDRTPQSA